MRPCIQSVWHRTWPAVVSTNITDLPSFCLISIFKLHSYVVIMGIYNFASFFVHSVFSCIHFAIFFFDWLIDWLIDFGLSAWGILVPWPGIEPVPPAVEAWSLNHWTTREVPAIFDLFFRSGLSLEKYTIKINLIISPLREILAVFQFVVEHILLSCSVQ